jgi:L-amino acid N-acyltransferase YncA
MLLIRRATEQDAAEIAHVHVQSWRTTYAGIVPDEYLAALNETERTALWREWLTRDIQVYIAQVEGTVVGFISGGPIREPVQNYDAELFAIYLLQQAQGQGIGSKLLKELAESLMNKGFARMAVWVLERNSAKLFYVKSSAQRLNSKEIEIAGVKPLRSRLRLARFRADSITQIVPIVRNIGTNESSLCRLPS